jgi:hypothetical protein
MKIITIGDIHGREIWKDKLFGSYQSFETWAKEVENGAHEVLSDLYPYHQYDKIVFVGDYVDSFTYGNAEILQNLKDIVLFKKTFPDRVVLLIGNHDVHYIIQDQICSGYRPEARFDLNKIYTENEDLFQLAFEIEASEFEGRKNRRIIWTHAGITGGWFKLLDGAFKSEKHKYREILKDYRESSISEKLNVAWKLKLPTLFLVDFYSGGMSQWAGPVWVRPDLLKWENISGYDQIVGHTPKRSIVKIWSPEPSEESNPEARDLIVLTDCLEHGDGSFFEFEFAD